MPARPRQRGTTSSAVRPDGNANSTTSIQSRTRFRRAFLIEEVLPDAVGIPHEDVRPAAGPAQRSVGDSNEVVDDVEFCVSGAGNSILRGFEIDTSLPSTVEQLAIRF